MLKDLEGKTVTVTLSNGSNYHGTLRFPVISADWCEIGGYRVRITSVDAVWVYE